MILLTGATGKTGGAVATQLAEKGVACRALVRDAGKAAPLAELGIELVIGDFADEAALGQALSDVDSAVLILPNSEQQATLEKRFIDAASKAGVGHVVKLSSMEATADTGSPIPAMHYQVECHLKESGLDWTMVRPNFFMQNLLSSAGTIKEQGRFFLPMGDGKTGMSDIRDIAAVIAEVLTATGHRNKSYEVTGPELLSFHDVAGRFSEVLGTTVSYVDMPADAYREMLAKFLASEWHLNAVCDLFAGIAAGGLEYKTDTVSQVLGREPISLSEFVQDHLAVFKNC